MLFVISLLIVLFINFALFLIAYNRQSDKLTDFAYALSFITTTAAILLLADHRTDLLVLLCTMVFIWAVRLGGFLVYRIRKSGKDSRFDAIRKDYIKFLQFWLGQGFVAWVLLLPMIFVASRGAEFGVLGYVGLLVWLMGLIIESIADQQKYRFNQNPDNKNKWIDQGLWHYSRHPNYFGEICVWIGMYLTAFQSLNPPERLVGLASPVAIFISLMFISGVPILEKAADVRWGNNKEYKAYKARTSLLVPLWNKK